jgi:hypothetical protein
VYIEFGKAISVGYKTGKMLRLSLDEVLVVPTSYVVVSKKMSVNSQHTEQIAMYRYVMSERVVEGVCKISDIYVWPVVQ